MSDKLYFQLQLGSTILWLEKNVVGYIPTSFGPNSIAVSMTEHYVNWFWFQDRKQCHFQTLSFFLRQLLEPAESPDNLSFLLEPTRNHDYIENLDKLNLLNQCNYLPLMLSVVSGFLNLINYLGSGGNNLIPNLPKKF